MKKALLLFLATPLLAFAQDATSLWDIDYPIEKINETTYKVQVTNFDSLHTSETTFLSFMNTGKNKPNGTLLVFDENGAKRRKAIYENGVRVGKHQRWYDTGELYSETTWKSGKCHSSEGFYKSGKIKHTGDYEDPDNSVYKSYYENGQLKSGTDWSNNSDKSWYENGNPKSERNSKSNIYKEWHENGQIKTEGKTQRGWNRIGTWKYYNEAGELTRELTYKDGNVSWYGDEKGYDSEKKY